MIMDRPIESNTLLQADMIVVKALSLVKRADPGPCELVIDLSAVPSSAVTLSVDDFADEYLYPAIAVALEHKRPVDESIDGWWMDRLDGATDFLVHRSYYGVIGRVTDAEPSCIDVRVTNARGAATKQDEPSD